MDYSTDAMGNYMGDFSAVDPYAQETEEERRLRLQREAEAAAQAAGPVTAPVAPTQDKMQPVKQTITTDPRTGKQTMKIEGSVQDLSPANPNTPTVMPPNYDKMLQVESGNRDFDAQGRPITSPKGAMFKAQVMPATAQKPGFGIRPASDQTPAEYNRVGQEYYQAMLNKYPGQPELARAAYNAGPGAVDAAIKKSMMEGGSPIDYLPKETQGYVQKTGGNVRMQGGKLKVEPQAQQPQPQPQAQQQPPAPAQQPPAPAQQQPPAPAPAAPEPQSPYSLASGQPSQGLSVPGMAPVTEQPAMGALPEAQQRFQSIQDDPSALLQYRNDANVPEPLRRRAGERASELLNSERNLSRAEARRDELIASGDGKAIANAMQGRGAKGEEGNWLKFVFLHALDPNLANAEAEKLGILPSKYEQTTITNEDGTTRAVEIKKSPSGKILEATNMDGTPLTADEMSSLNAMGGKKVHSAQTLIDPTSKQVVTQQVLSDGTMRYMAGGKVYTGNKDVLIPETAFTAQENKKTLASEKSASKKEEQQSKAEDRRVEGAIKALEKRIPLPTIQDRQRALSQAGVPAARIEQELGLPEGSLAGKVSVAPVRDELPPAAAPAPAVRPVAPSAVPPAPAPVARPAPKDIYAAEQPPEPPVPFEPGPGETVDSVKAKNKAQDEAYKKQLSLYENRNKLQQKDAEVFNKKKESVKSALNAYRKGVEIIDSTEHNLGPNFNTDTPTASLPKIQQFFGEQFGTDQADNTKLLRSLISRGGLEGLKDNMGPAISNFDVEVWMKNNPISENSTPAAMKAWLTKTHDALLAESEASRINAVKQGFVEPSFQLGQPLNKVNESTGTGTTSSGNKFKKVQ
jgi:hypothetical protein